MGTTVGAVVVKVVVRVPWVGLCTVTRKPLVPQIRLGVSFVLAPSAEPYSHPTALCCHRYLIDARITDITKGYL